MTPRQLLVLSALVMLIVGSQTAQYPPDFLAFPYLWVAASFLASLTCLVCAIRPTRVLVALSGATLVTISGARSLAIAGEVIAGNFVSAQAQASFIIAASTWGLISVLFLVVWREYVVPWSIGTRP